MNDSLPDERCGACGLIHADGDCDLDPANAPAEECHWCGRVDVGIICDAGTAAVGEPICHACTRQLRDSEHQPIAGVCTHDDTADRVYVCGVLGCDQPAVQYVSQPRRCRDHADVPDHVRVDDDLHLDPVEAAQALLALADTPAEHGDAWNAARTALVNAGVDLARAVLARVAVGQPDDEPAPWDGSAPLRAGTLRELLDDVDDDTPVVMDDGDYWYVNVASVVRPVDDDDYSCVTLFRGSAWDARSL